MGRIEQSYFLNLFSPVMTTRSGWVGKWMRDKIPEDLRAPEAEPTESQVRDPPKQVRGLPGDFYPVPYHYAPFFRLFVSPCRQTARSDVQKKLAALDKHEKS